MEYPILDHGVGDIRHGSDGFVRKKERKKEERKKERRKKKKERIIALNQSTLAHSELDDNNEGMPIRCLSRCPPKISPYIGHI